MNMYEIRDFFSDAMFNDINGKLDRRVNSVAYKE